MKLLTLLLLINFSFSQVKSYKIINIIDQKPISEAIIIDKNDIENKVKSDSEGNFTIKNTTEVVIIKDDYYDKTISLTGNSNIIFLEPIKTIELKDVIIGKEDINSILDSIKKTILNNKIHVHKPNFKYYNHLVSNNDTLLFFNDALIWLPEKGRYVSNNYKLIKKFEKKVFEHKVFGKNSIKLFKLDTDNIVFFKDFTFRSMSLSGINEFQDILNNRNKYDYIYEKNEDYYKIAFKSKSKGNNYEGYFIVDNYDYGVYELIINIHKTTTFTVVDYSKSKPVKHNYTLLKDNIVFKSTKFNNQYSLEKLSYNTEFILNQKKKKIKFFSKINIEPTESIKLINGKKFDIINFELL